jgi:hypothetical protein
MEWITDRRIGQQTGVLFIIAIVMIDIILIGLMLTQPISLLTFVAGLLTIFSLPLITLIVYQLRGLARSGYALDRNALSIFWGSIQQIVPTAAIQRIMLGSEVEGHIKFSGWRWPGLMVGHGEVPEAGLTLFYSTVPLSEQLIVITPTISYAISPTDVAGFIESIKARYELGPTQELEQTSVRPPIFDWPLWRDRIMYAFGIIGFVLCAALFAFVCVRYASLSPRLPLHYTAEGLPDRFGPPSQAFILPFIGLLALVGNSVLGLWVYRREQMAAYVLWGGMIFVQLLLWVGSLNLLKPFNG